MAKMIGSLVAFSLLLVGTSVCATPNFQYELWMQAETSLDIGAIEVQGQVVNTGTVTLDLTANWGALGGLPSNLSATTCGLECINNQLYGQTLDITQRMVIRNALFQGHITEQ